MTDFEQDDTPTVYVPERQAHEHTQRIYRRRPVVWSVLSLVVGVLLGAALVAWLVGLV